MRIKVSQIRETGRNAQGVKLMTLNEGEVIQDVATVISEEEEPADPTAEGTAEAAPASPEAAAGESPAEASEA